MRPTRLLQLIGSAALTVLLLSGALPAVAGEQTDPAQTTATSDPAPTATADASTTDGSTTEPTPIAGPTPVADEPAPAETTATEPSPTEPTATSEPTPEPTLAQESTEAEISTREDQITSFVPPLDWNPLEEPGAEPRLGEHLPVPGDISQSSTSDTQFGTQAYGKRTGDFKVKLVTVKLADKTDADVKAINLDAARASITSSSSYWKNASINRLSMTQVSEVRGFKSAAKSTQSYAQIMATVTKEIGWKFNSYEALVIFVPNSDLKDYYGNGGILGGGFTDSPTSGRVIMPYPSAVTNPVVAHEFGHVLGLHHSNSLYCSNGRADVARSGGGWADSACASYEYGDTVDLMGFAQGYMPMINSFLYEFGGFGRGDEIRNAGIITGSKRYNLTAWAGTEANRSVKFTDPISKEVYYLELRLPVGRDTYKAVDGNRGVKIIRKDNLGWNGNASIALFPNTRWTGYYNPNHAWQQGSTFTTYTGTKVSINSVTSTGATVTITQPYDRVDRRSSTPDFNGDGRGDLLHRRTDGSLWLSPGNGGNQFAAPVRIGTGWQIFTRVFGTGDFTGDRKNDIVARGIDGGLWLYPGNGAGGFYAAKKIGTGWNIFDEIFPTGDVTGDGIPDIAGRASGALYIYPGNGASGFKSRIGAGSGWGGLRIASGIGDHTGDGVADLYTRNSSGYLYLHRGLGNGQFASPVRIGSGWGGFTDIFTGQDMNRDGKNDVVVRASTGTLRAYMGNGSGVFLKELPLRNQWDYIATINGTDFDGNGLTDLLTVGSDGYLRLHSGNGSGAAYAPRALGRGWQNFTALMNGQDFDGDGKPDLIARTSAGALLLYRTDGAGGFTGRTQIGSGWSPFVNVVSPGDFNGDGNSDLVARTADGLLLLYPGNGAGGFLRPSQIGNGWQIFETITPGEDINGDGTKDLVALRSDGSAVAYPRTASGGWGTPFDVTATWGGYSFVATTGFSQPGRVDTLVDTPAGPLVLRQVYRTGSLSSVTLNAGKQ